MTHSATSPNADRSLRARHLSRRFGQTHAVDDLSLCVEAGEVCGFLGLNGAGKTTSLRMLCGTLAPDAGEVAIMGHDLHQQPLAARAQLGFLPDTPPLYPELTVDESLIYCAELHKVDRANIQRACESAKSKTGLLDCGSKRVSALSRGFRQRLGIAQTVVHQPAAIVLDEPTSGLDPRQIEEIRELIRSLAEDAAVLLSTHQLADVHAVCNRVAVMHNGKLAYDAAVDADLDTRFFELTQS
ncbi:MAG: ABC transporter ATP-binding protein [Pseudomonadota bacterium]